MGWFWLNTGGIFFTTKTVSIGIIFLGKCQIPQNWTILRFGWTSPGSCLDCAYARKGWICDPRGCSQCGILWLYDINFFFNRKKIRLKMWVNLMSLQMLGISLWMSLCPTMENLFGALLVLYKIKWHPQTALHHLFPQVLFHPPMQDTYLDNSSYSTAVALGNCSLL